MNKYTITAVRYHLAAQELLHIAWHEMSRTPSVAYQYTALLTLPDRNMLPTEADAPYQGPSCKLRTHVQMWNIDT